MALKNAHDIYLHIDRKRLVWRMNSTTDDGCDRSQISGKKQHVIEASLKKPTVMHAETNEQILNLLPMTLFCNYL